MRWLMWTEWSNLSVFRSDDGGGWPKQILRGWETHETLFVVIFTRLWWEVARCWCEPTKAEFCFVIRIEWRWWGIEANFLFLRRGGCRSSYFIGRFITSTCSMLVEMKDMLVSIWEMIDGHYSRQPITFYPKWQEFGYMLSMDGAKSFRNLVTCWVCGITFSQCWLQHERFLEVIIRANWRWVSNTSYYRYGLMES